MGDGSSHSRHNEGQNLFLGDTETVGDGSSHSRHNEGQTLFLGVTETPAGPPLRADLNQALAYGFVEGSNVDETRAKERVGSAASRTTTV
ncbi:MAG TPA: hypothetical protein VEK81_10780, partial [Burkholderiales bacterium]|nr:hypothetical protein [Burkholderiales bacterium]